MACLAKERQNTYRIHWKFTVKLGPRAGEVIQGSLHLGRCTKTAAKAKQREIEDWEERVKTGRFVPDRKADDVFQVWLRERKLTCTAQTLVRSERVMAAYRHWREERGLSCDTIEQLAVREELIAWRDHRLDHEAGRKTVANDLSTLSAFFQWCALERYLVENPVARISRPRFVTHKEGTPLTRTQAGQWLWAITVHTGRGGAGPRTFDEVRRKRQIIVLLLNTGLRNGELCGADIQDLRIDEHEQLLHVMGKGLKQRWVPLNRAAIAALRLHLRSRGNPVRGPLFTDQKGVRYNVRQLGAEIVQTGRFLNEGLDLNPHNLRHTFATWLARAGQDLSLVQKVLGHENVNTTIKYYIHTGDHELARATSNLRGRRRTEVERGPAPESFKVIPFPVRHVS